MALLRTALTLLSGAVLLVATGCGAGIISAGVFSNENRNNNPTPPVQLPALSLPDPDIPLVPPGGGPPPVRSVVISNLELPAAPELRVEISALGVVAVQGAPTVLSGEGSTTVVGFELSLADIAAATGDPTVGDVSAQLAVFVDDAEVAPAVPVTLLRQPSATLEPASTPIPLSPRGGTRVTLRVTALKALDVAELRMVVAVDDPEGGPRISRDCTNLTFQPLLTGDQALVAGDVPANSFPGQAFLHVQEDAAGESTVVDDVFYRPDIAAARPRQGPTTGGTLVSLIGAALAPLDFAVLPAEPAFDRLQIRFRKGGREVQLPPEQLRREESSLDQLVFTIPSSPDGRPGEVDIVLQVDLGTVTAEVTAADVFTYGDSLPVFGPRGAVLDETPVDAVPIRLESAPTGNDAPDFALLFDRAGVPFVQLLLAEENGMFRRFSAPQQFGDPLELRERDPSAVSSADFDDDGVPDLVIVNKGIAGGAAMHLVVLGQSIPRSPLGQVAGRILAAGGSIDCRAGDLDGDGRDDLVFLPGPTAPPESRPEVFLSAPIGPGRPAFMGMGALPIRAGPYDTMELADLDGDGNLDVVVVRGGLQPTVDIAYGVGDGTFQSGVDQQLDLDLSGTGYQPDPQSPAVGVHAVGGGTPRALAIAFAGLTANPATPQVVATLHTLPGQPRRYDPIVTQLLELTEDIPLGSSLAVDLNSPADGVPELIVSALGDAFAPSLPLAVLQWTGQTFGTLPLGIEPGAERPLSITQMFAGVAFPAEPGIRPDPARGVFVFHESDVDGVRERRLSTMLVAGGPTLLAPDAGSQIPVQILGHVAGNFGSEAINFGGGTKDLVLASAGEVRMLLNDGDGGFFRPDEPFAAPGIIPETLALVRVDPLLAVDQQDTLAFLSIDGTLSLLKPNEGQARESQDLRLLSPTPSLQTEILSPTSSIRSADIDGDGTSDLVLLLTFAGRSEAGEGLLMLLRGKASLTAGEFPFHLPARSEFVTLTHGLASDLAFGDFAPGSQAGELRLEVAVAVPTGSSTPIAGNHVRFYRYVAGPTPDHDSLRRSSATPSVDSLLAGDGPTRLGAADFDGNGTVDLVVASEMDNALRLFLNTGVTAGDLFEVNIAAFQESFTSPKTLAPGRPTFLKLGDINSDGSVDVLATTTESGVPGTSVAYYLSTGTGDFTSAFFVSQTRIGNRTGVMVEDLGDYNGDGLLDLSVAWDEAANRNVRVLFGGSR